MEAIDETFGEELPDIPVVAPFMYGGMTPYIEYQERANELEETLWDIEAVGGSEVSKKIRRLIEEMHEYEPSVTMIGQIKSGKTSLVNALVGRPNLLPADVNPWTSVVTSLHLNLPRAADAPAATFRFFDDGEWDNLVQNGGRIGELAARAGADQELDKLRNQVNQMREKTRERLGRKFELLLGQEHVYEQLDDTLLQRYICMGDDFDELSKAEKQGQFADITRSAELYLDAPHIPRALCIRDTPGVNDTFMMREQITIRAIRDSKICVAVLSAHQALNTTDMALIRLIASVRSRQVVVFVNRIDELRDPGTQIPEIRASLTDTIAKVGQQEELTILFGSALWATAAIEDDIVSLPDDSMASLTHYAKAVLGQAIDPLTDTDRVWQLSGVPDLMEAITERIAEGGGEVFLQSVKKRAINFVSALRASSSIVTLRSDGAADNVQKLTNPEVQALMDEIEAEGIAGLNAHLDDVFAKFGTRVDQARDRFLSRAVESLLVHLERFGEEAEWNYSPDGLRMLMRTAHQVMRKNYAKACGGQFDNTAAILTRAYGEIFTVTADSFIVQAPEPPEIAPPVTLAKTIALDLRSSWWKSWWGRRKGYRSFASGFHDLIAAEIAPIIDDLKGRQMDEIRANAHATFDSFLSEQRGILADICTKAQVGLEELHGLFGVTAQEEREELFELIYEELEINEIEDRNAA